MGLFPCHIVGGSIIGQQVFLHLLIPDKEDVRAAVGGEIVAVKGKAGVHAPAQILPAFAFVFGTVNFEPAGQIAQIPPAVQTGVVVPCAVEIAEQRAVHRPFVGRGADVDAFAQTLKGIKRGIAQHGVAQPCVHVCGFCVILFHRCALLQKQFFGNVPGKGVRAYSSVLPTAFFAAASSTFL